MDNAKQHLVYKIERLRRELGLMPGVEERNNSEEIASYLFLVDELYKSLAILQYHTDQETHVEHNEQMVENVEVEEEVIQSEEPVAEVELEDERIESIEDEHIAAPIEEEVPVENDQSEPVQAVEEKDEEVEEEPFKKVIVDRREKIEIDTREINEINHSDAMEIVDQLANQPISDLRKAFGLNERFYYTNELFGGDGQEFVRALNEFNHLASFEDAQRLIDAKYVLVNNWDLEGEVVVEFLSIVKRRYI